MQEKLFNGSRGAVEVGFLQKAMAMARWAFLNWCEMLSSLLITTGNLTAVFNILMLITWKAMGRRKERKADCLHSPWAYQCLSLKGLRTGWLPYAAVLILPWGQGYGPLFSLGGRHTHSLPGRFVLLSIPMSSCGLARVPHSSLLPCSLQR